MNSLNKLPFLIYILIRVYISYLLKNILQHHIQYLNETNKIKHKPFLFQINFLFFLSFVKPFLLNLLNFFLEKKQQYFLNLFYLIQLYLIIYLFLFHNHHLLNFYIHLFLNYSFHLTCLIQYFLFYNHLFVLLYLLRLIGNLNNYFDF